MKKIIFLIIVINFTLGSFLFSDGSESIDLCKSPDILVSGGSYVSEQPPMSSIFNPASNALEQRVSLNLNYIGLFGDMTATGKYNGTGINLGGTIPLQAGVITASGYYLIAEDMPEFFAGDKGQGGFNINFSKEIYEDFLFGIGISSYFGTGWGVTADLGIIKHQGELGFLKNLKWGIVLGELGYSTFKTTESDAPSLFTPGGGIAFDLLDNEKVKFNIDSSIDFPSCQNIRFTLGGDFNLFNYGGLRFSSTADLSELLKSDVSALVPAFGLYVNLKTNFKEKKFAENGLSNNDVKTSVSAKPMENGLWGISAGINVNLGVIDKEAPKIEFDFSKYREDENLDNPPPPSTPKDEKEKKEVSFKGKGYKNRKTFMSNDKNTQKEKAILNDNTVNLESSPQNEEIIAYISPNNDGIQDSLEIPLSITDSRYIKGYSFFIEDAEGNVVKIIENKEKRPENQGILNFFQRLFYVEKGIDVIESIRWDGIGDNGEIVPDGLYVFYMKAWDDNGNTSQTDRYGLVVDNTPPVAVVDDIPAVKKIFSPNNDGNKDEIIIEQRGSQEDLWKGVVKGAGGSIFRNFKWLNGAPQTFSWDGKDDNNILVADGVYFYYLSSTDKAGNSIEKEMPNIIINTQSTPISLSVDVSSFAPGNKDAVNKIDFSFNVPVKNGIEEWSLKIKDKTENLVKIFSGESIIESISYDGIIDSGFLPEGDYKAVLEIMYINGNNPSAESPVFTVDRTAPVASAKASLKVFSPNGDGKKDEITIYQDSSKEDAWYGYIEDEKANVIKEYKWVYNAPSSFSWDGYKDDGGLASDGTYFYRLKTIDKAGNKGETITEEFSLDTEETPVMITSEPQAFSPNGDKIKDSVFLKPIVKVNEGIKSYLISIKDDNGNSIKTITGRGKIDESYVWDGFTDNVIKAPDGRYSATLKVVYEKGDVSEANTRSFTLDTRYPELEVKSDYTIFSPDNDGKKDSIQIFQQSSAENNITAVIKNAKGVAVRSYNWENKAANIIWDGTDDNGNKVPDGTYSYSIKSQDEAGNLTIKTVDKIQLDTRLTNVFVTTASRGFTPNNDGKDDLIEFATITTIKDGIESWAFNIMDASGKIVKTFTDEFLPEKIIWDGSNEDGKISEGSFTAEYKVKYKKGNEPSSLTKAFVIDTTPPKIYVEISPKPFSPDNDGVDDELSIKLDVKDASDIKEWTFDIIDREKNNFVTFSGLGMPSKEILWDGIGNNGELVLAAEDYAYRFTVTDQYENKDSDYGIIPIDVLVVRDGNNLKIRIANITFAADSARLRQDDPEIKKKNEYVLARLTEILKKYDNYKILIEGHAVSVFWNDAEKAEKEETQELIPLSKARAETVKNYLTKLGINSDRMSTEGLGGKKPLVPHGDMVNRWKNRRVEFILIK